MTVCLMIVVYQKNKSPTSDYLWIHKLTGSTRYLDAAAGDAREMGDPVSKYKYLPIEFIMFLINFLQLVELDSPDLLVPRRNIATGKTPVALRESVVRCQMACKEADYTYTETLRLFIVNKIDH